MLEIGRAVDPSESKYQQYTKYNGGSIYILQIHTVASFAAFAHTEMYRV